MIARALFAVALLCPAVPARAADSPPPPPIASQPRLAPPLPVAPPAADTPPPAALDPQQPIVPQVAGVPPACTQCAAQLAGTIAPGKPWPVWGTVLMVVGGLTLTTLDQLHNYGVIGK